MRNIQQAIFELYPQVVTVYGYKAVDKDGIEVAYDLNAITAKAEANEQKAISVKESALAKLSALGLTQDEVKALVG